MICSKCGNSIPNEDDFCPKCGHKITAEEHNYVTGIVKSSTVETLRSPLFTVICISLLGFILCVVAGWFIPIDFSGYADGLESLDAPQNVVDIINKIPEGYGKLQIVKILILFVVTLPIFLSTIGLFMLRSHVKGHLRSNGVDVVKIGLKVAIIYFALAALGCLAGGVIFIAFGGYSDPTSLAWSVPAFSVVMIFVVAALALLVKLVSLADIIKEAVTNDDFTEPPSRYMQVMSVLLGLMGVLIGAAILAVSLDILTTATIMLWSMAQIFLGIFVGKIRKLDSEFYGGLYDTVYKKSETVEYKKSFCPRCGRELWGAEVCTCIPKHYERVLEYDRMKAAESSHPRGIKSTMPETVERKSTVSGGNPGSRYFKKPNKL